jgi:hypothetical protein
MQGGTASDKGQMLWTEQAKVGTSKCIATDDPRLKGN